MTVPPVPPKPELTGKDLKISYIMPPEGEVKGIWIIGSVQGHAFFARINVEPAQNPHWELGKSRISDLEVRRLSDWHSVFYWSCGPAKLEKDPLGKEQETKAIVRFLASGPLTEIGRVKELLGLSRTEQQPTLPTDETEQQKTKVQDQVQKPSDESPAKNRQKLGPNLELGYDPE